MSNFDHAPLSQIFTKLIPFESHKYNKFMGSQPQHVSLNTLKPSFGICMVATKTYLEKWFNVASDFENIFLDKLGDVTIHLFTDQPELARVWASNNLKKVNFRSYEILSWGWPEVTLYRYKFFSEKSKYLTEDILMYLDSDMRILADFSTELEFEKWDSGIALVQHPGFHRNKGFAAILDLLCNPKLILSLVVKFFKPREVIANVFIPSEYVLSSLLSLVIVPAEFLVKVPNSSTSKIDFAIVELNSDCAWLSAWLIESESL